MPSKERVFGSQLEMAQVLIKETAAAAAAARVFSFLCWLNRFVTAIQLATGFGLPPKILIWPSSFHIKLMWEGALSVKETHSYKETPAHI